jgi:hypothetical protein
MGRLIPAMWPRIGSAASSTVGIPVRYPSEEYSHHDHSGMAPHVTWDEESATLGGGQVIFIVHQEPDVAVHLKQRYKLESSFFHTARQKHNGQAK